MSISEGTVSQNIVAIKESILDIPTIPEIASKNEENEESPIQDTKLNITDKIDSSKLDTLVPSGLVSAGAP